MGGKRFKKQDKEKTSILKGEDPPQGEPDIIEPKSAKPKKKKKIIKPFKWTRIVNRDKQGLEIIDLHDGLKDIDEAKKKMGEYKCEEPLQHRHQFFPEAFEVEDWDYELMACHPTIYELKAVAKSVSLIRQSLLEKANEIEQKATLADPGRQQSLKKLKEKLYRSKFSDTERGLVQNPDYYISEDISCRKYKKKKLSEISVDDKRQIILLAVLQKLPHDEIARQFRASKAQVSYLVSKAKNNSEYIDELMAMEQNRNDKVNLIIDSAEQMMKSGNNMESSGAVQEHMRQNGLIPATSKDICSVLRNDLKMTYRKVHKVQPLANSSRSLVLRSRFATCQLDLLTKGKRIINVDESTIGESSFRRRSWQGKGYAASQPISPVKPSTSLVTAIDSEGDVYWSLLQTYSCDPVFGMFIMFLVEQLDIDRPGWRANSIIQLDGAPYHKSSETLILLESLKVPYIISGPYSYDGSPIELFFATLKYGMLNPNNLPMTKKFFINVVTMIQKRTYDIQASTVVSLQMQSTLNLMRYIDLKKL